MDNLTESQLAQLCEALGWQGGTWWQVLERVRFLATAFKFLEDSQVGQVPNVFGDQKLYWWHVTFLSPLDDAYNLQAAIETAQRELGAKAAE